MAIKGKITSRGFEGNLIGTASWLSGSNGNFAANELFQEFYTGSNPGEIVAKIGGVQKSLAVDTAHATSASYADVANLAHDYDGDLAASFTPGTGLQLNLGIKVGQKQVTASFDADHNHDGIYEKVADFNTYTASVAADIAKAHEHGNKDLLDSLTEAKTGSWDAKQDAIEDVTYSAGADKFITGFDQVDGQITNVTSGSIEIPELPEYTITKDSGSLPGDVASRYHLTKDGVAVGTAIDVYKDQFLKNVRFFVATEEDVEEHPELVKDHAYIEYTFQVIPSETYPTGEKIVYMDVSTLVDSYSAGQGINISEGREISVVIDETTPNEGYLTLSDNGLKVSGIDSAIATAKSEAISAAAGDATSKADAAESASKAYAKNAVDFVAASGSALNKTHQDAWNSASDWVEDNTGSLETAASMTQSGYVLTANFRGQTASTSIASASYAANADVAKKLEDKGASLTNLTKIYVDATGSIIFDVAES